MDLHISLSEVLRTKKDYLKALDEMNLRTVEDLLLYFPRAYEDLSVTKPLHEVETGETVTLKGYLKGLAQVPTKRSGFRLLKAHFYDDAGNTAEVVWFNQPHLLRTLPMETAVRVAGKVERSYGKITLHNPTVEMANEASLHTAGLVPVYPEHDCITSKWLRGKIHPLLPFASEFPEILPDDILLEEKLMGKAIAVAEVHFPTSAKTLQRARDRLGYEELFLLQLNAIKSRAEWRQSRGKESPVGEIKMDVEFVKQFFSTLPFQPTGAQKVAIFEILKDLEKPYPMMRLLEGDVGSGKTLVATLAILSAIRQGNQAALMVPTEVLAQQHFVSLRKLIQDFEQRQAGDLAFRSEMSEESRELGTTSFEREKISPLPVKATPINIQILTGSLPAAQRKAVHEGLKNGEIDLVIGTHALVQEAVAFHKLGLVVVDEQHRFGVKQREVLIRQGSPHVLTMTATPIPRTLAMVAYGDQDLSVLNEMPPGRQPIITKVVPPNHRSTVYRFLEGKMQAGEQVYVICPLIDESDELEFKSVKAEFERLKTIFQKFSVAMLHGRMKSEEKEAIMAEFKAGSTHLLVSTSVIEVGIDVPNASIMLIEGADRFGLSQLHQFRGRVGRGKAQSYCFLFTDSTSPATFTRLKAMVDHTDGFKLAEIDLQLRGPGEVYGLRQSGIPDLKIASLSNGILISRVRKAAEYLIDQSPSLDQFPQLKIVLNNLGIKDNSRCFSGQ